MKMVGNSTNTELRLPVSIKIPNGKSSKNGCAKIKKCQLSSFDKNKNGRKWYHNRENGIRFSRTAFTP